MSPARTPISLAFLPGLLLLASCSQSKNWQKFENVAPDSNGPSSVASDPSTAREQIQQEDNQDPRRSKQQRSIRSGIYRLVAHVKAVQNIGSRRSLRNGMHELDGKRTIFVDVDQRFLLTMTVVSVDDPVWFLEPGRPVHFAVHSPTLVFREKGKWVPIGEDRLFELHVTAKGRAKGEFRYSELLSVHLEPSRQ